MTAQRAKKKTRFRVADIMSTVPITVSPSESIEQADELMVTNNIRQLPVVKKNELIGIITDRDIRSFLSNSLASTDSRDRALNTPVQEVMTTEPISVAPDDELEEVVELLIDEKFGAVPVVDEAEGIMGIVSYVDVLRCFLNTLQDEVI